MSTPSRPATKSLIFEDHDPDTMSRKNRRTNPTGAQIKVDDIAQGLFTPPDWGGSLTSLCLIPQGLGVNERQANRILPVSIRVAGVCRADPTYTAATSQALRIVLFQDKQQASDSAPSADDVLEDTNSIDAVWTPTHDKDVPGKVYILDDQVFWFGPGMPCAQPFELSNRKPMLPISYNGASSTDIQKNGLYMLLITSTTTSPTPANYWPSGLAWNSRIMYRNF